MLEVNYLFSDRYPDFLDFLNDETLYEIAKRLYKAEFEDYCNDSDVGFAPGTTDIGKFATFIEETKVDMEVKTLEEVLRELVRKENFAACVIDAYMDSNDYHWRVSIMQIVPTTKEDLIELIKVFVNQNDVSLPEVVVDGIKNSLNL